jgi:hypothetical protein
LWAQPGHFPSGLAVRLEMILAAQPVPVDAGGCATEGSKLNWSSTVTGCSASLSDRS